MILKLGSWKRLQWMDAMAAGGTEKTPYRPSSQGHFSVSLKERHKRWPVGTLNCIVQHTKQIERLFDFCAADFRTSFAFFPGVQATHCSFPMKGHLSRSTIRHILYIVNAFNNIQQFKRIGNLICDKVCNQLTT